MNKKFKYTSLVAAGAVTLGLVGGTLAWFTSQDQVKNAFATGGEIVPEGPEENGKSGIYINEEFDSVSAGQVTPGSNVNKDVQVKSTVDYPQFVKTTIQVEIANGTDTPTIKNVMYDKTKNVFYVDGYEDIVLTFTDHLAHTMDEGSWYNKEYTDLYNEESPAANQVAVGQFYYIGKVGAYKHTNTLLDSVKLNESATDSKYKNLDFKVVVNANGIQATNQAYASPTGWNLGNGVATGTLAGAYYTLDQKPYDYSTNAFDAMEADNVKVDGQHNHAHTK